MILVSDIIDRCAMQAEGGRTNRIGRDAWLLHYNNVQLEIATEVPCIETDAKFDIQGLEARYAYPSDMVTMKRLWYSETPTDENTYRKLGEVFPDEWENQVSGNYPRGYVRGYISRPSFFQLVAKPESDIVDGGLITYWTTPVWQIVEDGIYFELPDFLQKYAQDGMMIRAGRSSRERAAAMQDYRLWLDSLSNLREKMEDRSDDRRSAIRPEGFSNPYQGQQ